MGAWIEIIVFVFDCFSYCVAPHDGCVDWNRHLANHKKSHLRRTPRWVRGLKLTKENKSSKRYSRTPRWVRGLKWTSLKQLEDLGYVAPHDGCVDWNTRIDDHTASWSLSHPTMGAWIEINTLCVTDSIPKSHPTMGAWIEIWIVYAHLSTFDVAPHDGCVDWNNLYINTNAVAHMSHPTMGAWIEIVWLKWILIILICRTPRWVRGLKCIYHYYVWLLA